MFVTIEGIDGCGKTTQTKLLSKWLESKNIEHILTKEPGSIISKECQQIRKILLDPENKIEPRAELLLYLADRAQHVEQIIKPALEQKKWVISDRFALSTKVYQGYGRGLKNIDELLLYAQYNLHPNFTIILDLPVEISLERARKNNKEFKNGDRIEKETLEFHNKLRAGFQNEQGMDLKLLDANKSENDLHEEIKKEVWGAYELLFG